MYFYCIRQDFDKRISKKELDKLKSECVDLKFTIKIKDVNNEVHKMFFRPAELTNNSFICYSKGFYNLFNFEEASKNEDKNIKQKKFE